MQGIKREQLRTEVFVRVIKKLRKFTEVWKYASQIGIFIDKVRVQNRELIDKLLK